MAVWGEISNIVLRNKHLALQYIAVQFHSRLKKYVKKLDEGIDNILLDRPSFRWTRMSHCQGQNHNRKTNVFFVKWTQRGKVTSVTSPLINQDNGCCD